MRILFPNSGSRVARIWPSKRRYLIKVPANVNFLREFTYSFLLTAPTKILCLNSTHHIANGRYVLVFSESGLLLTSSCLWNLSEYLILNDFRHTTSYLFRKPPLESHSKLSNSPCSLLWRLPDFLSFSFLFWKIFCCLLSSPPLGDPILRGIFEDVFG